MINSVEKALRKNFVGEFEEVGVKQRNADILSSEEEDYRIPNTLYVQLDVAKETLKNDILQGLQGVPLTTALLKESVKEVEQFLNPELLEGLKNTKSADDSSWVYPRSYTVTCL